MRTYHVASVRTTQPMPDPEIVTGGRTFIVLCEFALATADLAGQDADEKCACTFPGCGGRSGSAASKISTANVLTASV